MKKLLSLALCLCMAFGFSAQSVFAADDEAVPYWVEAKYAEVALNFSNGMAQVTGKILGNNGTNKITATFRLEKQNANGSYSEIAVWTNRQSYSDVLSFSGQYAVSRGNYRAIMTAVVERGGRTENISKTAYGTY